MTGAIHRPHYFVLTEPKGDFSWQPFLTRSASVLHAHGSTRRSQPATGSKAGTQLTWRAMSLRAGSSRLATATACHSAGGSTSSLTGRLSAGNGSQEPEPAP